MILGALLEGADTIIPPRLRLDFFGTFSALRLPLVLVLLLLRLNRLLLLIVISPGVLDRVPLLAYLKPPDVLLLRLLLMYIYYRFFF